MATRFYASSPSYSPRGSRQRHKSRTHYCVPGRRESACCARTGPATRHSPVGDRSWSLTAISSRRSPRADAHGLRGTAHAATARPPFHVAEAHGPTRRASLNRPRGDRMAFLEHLANIGRLSEKLQAHGLRGTAHAATAWPSSSTSPTSSASRRSSRRKAFAEQPTRRPHALPLKGAGLRADAQGPVHASRMYVLNRQGVACACIAHVRTQLTGRVWPVHASRMSEHS